MKMLIFSCTVVRLSTPEYMPLFKDCQYRVGKFICAVQPIIESIHDMSSTASTELELVDKAVLKLKTHPTLTVSEAMQLAGFSLSERCDKNMQRKVLRRLPGKGKRKFKTLVAASSSTSSFNASVSSVIIAGSANDTSPISGLSESTGDDGDKSIVKKFPLQRLNSKQKQNKRIVDLNEWESYKKAHKEGTKLYDNERKKDGGMSLWKIAQEIKTKHKGVGLCAESIRPHVVDLQRA